MNTTIIDKKKSIQSTILHLAIPSILALMIKALYNIADTAYIGLLHDENALAAVGITFPLLLIINSIEQIFAMGSGILISKYLGSKEKEKADWVASSVFAISIILGLITSICGILLLNPILRAVGCSNNLMPMARSYAFYIMFATIYTLPYQSMNAISRSESCVKLPCIAIVISALLNIILDPIFIFPLHLGVTGASVATAISQFVSFLIMLIHFKRHKSSITIAYRYIHITKSLLFKIICTGLPTALTQLLTSLSTLVTNLVIVSVTSSNSFLAAYSITQKVVIIGYYIIIGFSQGVQPVASFNYGAKEKKKFITAIKYSLIVMVSLGFFITIVYSLFASFIYGFFTSSTVVITYGKKLIISQVLFYSLFAVTYLLTILLQIIGKYGLGILLSTLRQGLLYLPLCIILPYFLKVQGIYLVQPCADILSFIIYLIAIRLIKNDLLNHFQSIN